MPRAHLSPAPRPSPARGSWRAATLLLGLALATASCTDRPDPVAPPSPPATGAPGLGTSSLVGAVQAIEPSAIANDVNDRGQVVGERAGRRGFIWSADQGMRELGGLFGSTQSVAHAINEAGQVVGASGAATASRAFLWSEGDGMVDLGRHANMSSSAALDINIHGHVVGHSFEPFTSGSSRAFIWTPEHGMRDLGTLGSGRETIAYAINDRGEVVGTSGGRAFIWTAEGGMRDLGILSIHRSVTVHMGAYGINNAGHVVGGAAGNPDYRGGSIFRAWIWTPEGGLRDLGTLGGSNAAAYDINDHDEVVGYANVVVYDTPRAFRWTEGTGMQELALPASNAPSLTATYASAINDVGQAAGRARGGSSGDPALLWTLGGSPAIPGALLVSRHSGLCLDVAGGSREAGTPLITWSCHGGDPQRFTLPAANTQGEVRVYDAMCLDDGSGQPDNGDRMIIWPCHGGASQQWRLTSQGDLRTSSGKCADLDAWGTAPGTWVILWDCHGGANQQWNVRQDVPTWPAGAVMLVNEHTGLCLDVAGGNQAPGGRVIQYTCHGGAPQRWTLPVNNGPGNVTVYDGALCLDDAGGRGENGDTIGTWTCHSDPPQQWTLTPEGLLKGINGKCVDVEGWQRAPGIRLILWDCHGGANQRWRIRRE